jgi:transcriptional regulator with XRE-family HTH domain
MDSIDPFDLGKLYRCIDEARLERKNSWSALARQVGVAASTIRRFERANDAEADGVLTLVAWLGETPETFLANHSAEQERLPPLNGGVIRADSTVIAELSMSGRAVRPGSRTTIQRLARLADAHARTIASLARWSAS